jgi:hypothetical protein
MAFRGPHRPMSIRSKVRAIALGVLALLLLPLAVGSVFFGTSDPEGGPRICMMGLMIFVALLIATSYVGKQLATKPTPKQDLSPQDQTTPPPRKK